jgi:hypothetical protein
VRVAFTDVIGADEVRVSERSPHVHEMRLAAARRASYALAE